MSFKKGKAVQSSYKKRYITKITKSLLVYIESMYKDPSRSPYIETIYPTLLEFGKIQAIILSYWCFKETKSRPGFLEFLDCIAGQVQF